MVSLSSHFLGGLGIFAVGAISTWSHLVLASPDRISPWTGQTYPEEINSPPMRVYAGFDSQLLDRSALHWMFLLDWEKIQWAVSRKDAVWQHAVEKVGDDYDMTQAALDRIRAQKPSVYVRLTEGLNLVRPNLLPATGALPLQNHSPIESRPLASRESGLIVPVLEGNLQNRDWVVLNRRWKNLSLIEKAELFYLPLASPAVKVRFLRLIKVMDSLGYEAKTELNFLSQFGSPEHFNSFAHLHMNNETQFNKDVDSYPGLEFRLVEPMSDLTEFLDFVYDFNLRSNRLQYIQSPKSMTHFRDGDFHLHLSLPDGEALRLEDLSVIAKLWNLNVLLYEIVAGDVTWSQRPNQQFGFYTDLKKKGYVRLVSPYRLEIRNHIFGPQTTVELFVKLVSLSDEQVYRYFLDHLFPKLKPEHIMDIFRKRPAVFNVLYDDLGAAYGSEFDDHIGLRVAGYLLDKPYNLEPLFEDHLVGFDTELLESLQKIYKTRLSKLSSEERLGVLPRLLSSSGFFRRKIEIPISFLGEYFLGLVSELVFGKATLSEAELLVSAYLPEFFFGVKVIGEKFPEALPKLHQLVDVISDSLTKDVFLHEESKMPLIKEFIKDFPSNRIGLLYFFSSWPELVQRSDRFFDRVDQALRECLTDEEISKGVELFLENFDHLIESAEIEQQIHFFVEGGIKIPVLRDALKARLQTNPHFESVFWFTVNQMPDGGKRISDLLKKWQREGDNPKSSCREVLEGELKVEAVFD